MDKLKHAPVVHRETMGATRSDGAEGRPCYAPPAVVTLTDRQLLAELGPAQMGGYFIPFGDMFNEGIP